jgi:hypothetical protein
VVDRVNDVEEAVTPTFHVVDSPEVHKVRAREILRDHPGVRDLIGRNPYSVLVILGGVGLQLGLAYSLRDQAWWAIVVTAYVVDDSRGGTQSELREQGAKPNGRHSGGRTQCSARGRVVCPLSFEAPRPYGHL